jgi:hypothetical protein
VHALAMCRILKTSDYQQNADSTFLGHLAHAPNVKKKLSPIRKFKNPETRDTAINVG